MKKKAICLLLASALVLALAACGAKKLTGDEAWNALKSAEKLHLTGDLDDVNTFSDILADGYIVGRVQEKGLIDSSMAVSVDGKEEFYYKFVTSGEIMEGKVGTTYGCFDMDGSCLGYMQLRFGSGTSRYAFLDADGNEKGCYLDDNLTTLTDSRGEIIGSVEAKLDSMLTHAFHVTVTTSSSSIDYIDKLAIYWCAVTELNSDYSYLT